MRGNFFPFRCEAGEFCATNKTTIAHTRIEPSVDGFFSLTTPEVHYQVTIDQIRDVSPKG